MCPRWEANPDGNGKIQLETSGADAPGRTSTEIILAEVSECLEPGISGNVIPGAVSTDLEAPGMLRGLMAL